MMSPVVVLKPSGSALITASRIGVRAPSTAR